MKVGLIEERLTDGSIVFNVVCNELTFFMDSEASALELMSLLEQNCVDIWTE